MPSPNEFNKKIEISIGMIIFIIAITFSATKFYTELVTVEQRMDKRYERQNQKDQEQDAWMLELDERLISLEKRDCK